jgi:imidazole glycerol-phosphate synthase subunit HisF
MLKHRLIPVLLYKNGILVRSSKFSFHQSTGDPVHQVERFTAWKADELIYLDISRDGEYDYRKTMQVIGTTSSQKNIDATMASNFLDVVRLVAQKCAIPLTVGGKIQSLDDIKIRLAFGADKVSINTKALADPSFVEQASKEFGSQCIVVSIDAQFDEASSTWEVYSKFGKEKTGLDPISWAREAEGRGAGEILLQSIDRDGVGNGYDIPLIQCVSDSVSIPVIALGGVGTFEHLVDGLVQGRASAVAAANIFHFTEHSIMNAKRYMKDQGVDVRL